MPGKLLLLFLIFNPLNAKTTLYLAFGAEAETKKLKSIPVYEAGGFYETDSLGAFGIKFSFSRSSFENREISGTSAVGISNRDIVLIYRFRLMEFFSINFSAHAGSGLRIKRRDSYIVDLGVAGKKKIAGISENFAVFLSGVVISKNVNNILSIYISPEFLIHNFKELNTSYRLTGGLDFAF